MNVPVPAVDVAKKTLAPFLDPDVSEKLFAQIKLEIEELSDLPPEEFSQYVEPVVLAILIDIVEKVREHWQEKQVRSEVTSTPTKDCSATAIVAMNTPGVLQISMACKGPHQHLESEMVSKAISSIRKAVKEYKHADSSS